MKRQYFTQKALCWIMLCGLVLGGCARSTDIEIEKNKEKEDLTKEMETVQESESLIQTSLDTENDNPEEPAITNQQNKTQDSILEADWSAYFGELNGAAVIYDAADSQYTLYNTTLATTPRSPCSTFKIVSSLIALENGFLEPEDSTRTWSGEVFWNQDWNRDIGFQDAFRTSCVWYFRELIDTVGQETMQSELNRLHYGNCDISDWEGRLNTNNNHRALTGFWLESSLLISPKEQTEVMARIFGETSVYSEKTRETLRQVMLVAEQDEPPVKIYGKTGMGKTGGVTVDAWFTGFAEKPSEEKTVYFCVYLGRTDNQNVTSAAAKEIAVRLVSDYLAPES